MLPDKIFTSLSVIKHLYSGAVCTDPLSGVAQNLLNPFKPSAVKWLDFKVFRAHTERQSAQVPNVKK